MVRIIHRQKGIIQRVSFVFEVIAMILVMGFISMAAPTDTQTDGASDEVVFVDDSAYILQAGGLLESEELSRDEAPRYLSIGTDTYKTLAETIAEGWKNRATKISIASYGLNLSEDEMKRLYRGALNSYPEYFYVSSSYGYLVSGQYYVPKYDSKYTDQQVQAFHDAAESIIQQVPSGLNEKQKYLWVHDYLVTHCEYDLNYNNYNAYNVLVEKTAVCQGYALTYRYLLSLLGLNAELVTSETMNHAWNIVKLDGSYYHVDCTWDDPSNHWYEGYCGHENFMRSEKGLRNASEKRTGTDWKTPYNVEGNIIGKATSTLYDSYFWKDVITAIPMISGKYVYSLSGKIYFRNLNESNTEQVTLPSGCNPSCYSSLATDGRRVYYNSGKALYQLDMDKTVTKLYELSQEQLTKGTIYGLVMDGNAIAYNVGKAAYNTTFSRYLYQLPATDGYDASVKFANASLTFSDSIKVNFMADRSLFVNSGFTKPYAVFEFNGSETRVDAYSDSDGYYKFSFDKVAPHMFGMNIKATLYAEKNGVLYHGGTTEYSVKQYCTNMLKDGSGASGNLKTLVVDLLNYGAAAQLFMDPATQQKDLVNYDMTSEQKALGTSAVPTMQSIKDAGIEVVTSPEVNWVAVGLYLRDNVSFRFEFVPPANTSGLTAKIWDDNGHEWTYDADNFVMPSPANADGSIYLYFNGYAANRFRDAVYVAFYRNGTKVSNTLKYSVESYCHSKSTADTGSDQDAVALKNLAIALMKYGDSVVRYVNANNQ